MLALPLLLCCSDNYLQPSSHLITQLYGFEAWQNSLRAQIRLYD